MPPEDTTLPGSDRLRAALEAAEREEFDDYFDRMDGSLDRTGALVSLSHQLTGRTEAQDVLRAAVVLAHAYLEDFLRTVAARLLPDADERCLNEIPLAGLPGRPKKFSLGNLVQHTGKRVDDVVRESVCEYLDRSTFNNTDDIAQLLNTLGFEPSDHNQDFPVIQEMMKRRHQIVHRADRTKLSSSDAYGLQRIDPSEVVEWVSATSRFMRSLVQVRARRSP